MLPDELSDGNIGGPGGEGLAEELSRHLQFCPPAQQRGCQEREEACGDHEHQAIRQGKKPAAPEDVSHPQVVIRSDDFVLQSQVAGKLPGPGFGGKEAVRAGLEQATFDDFGLNDAAEPRLLFDERRADPGFGQVVGG